MTAANVGEIGAYSREARQPKLDQQEEPGQTADH